MYRLRIFLRAMKRNQQLKNVLRNLVKNGTDRTKLRPIYVKRGDVPKPYIYIYNIYTKFCLDLGSRVSRSLRSLANNVELPFKSKTVCSYKNLLASV